MTLLHISLGAQDYMSARGVNLVLLGVYAYFVFDVRWGFHWQRFELGVGVDWSDVSDVTKGWSYVHLPRAPR